MKLTNMKSSFIRIIINNLREYPVLWNRLHKHYRNNKKITEAYKAIWDKLRQINGNLKFNNVCNIITHLIRIYRIERQRKRDDPHHTTQIHGKLWLFDALTFIDHVEEEVHTKSVVIEPKVEPSDDCIDICSSSSESVEYPINPYENDNVKDVNHCRTTELPKSHEFMSEHVSEDNPSIIIVWREKLTTLDMQQRLFAEKAINDILFEARLGNLNRNSIRINEH